MSPFWEFVRAYPWVVVVGIVFAYAGFKAFTNMLTRASESKERETTKREIAAYVAEGSMTPEQAERLIAAAPPRKAAWEDCC